MVLVLNQSLLRGEENLRGLISFVLTGTEDVTPGTGSFSPYSTRITSAQRKALEEIERHLKMWTDQPATSVHCYQNIHATAVIYLTQHNTIGRVGEVEATLLRPGLTSPSSCSALKGLCLVALPRRRVQEIDKLAKLRAEEFIW